jgi:hydrogenase nickel incorporation protein HypA/HybF
MHELGLALEIVDLVAGRAAGSRVKSVLVGVGVLSAVEPDALGFCFELATEGTPLAGAELRVQSEAAQARCRTCGLASTQSHILARCACGASDFEWLTGSELKVLEVEVA